MIFEVILKLFTIWPPLLTILTLLRNQDSRKDIMSRVDDSLLYLASQDCSLFSFLHRVKFPLFFFWVSQGRPIFPKGVSSDSSIFPSLWFLTGKEWYRGRVCWVGFKLSLLYFPLPMVPYGAGVTEGPHLLGGFWVKFPLSQFRFLCLLLSQFI